MLLVVLPNSATAKEYVLSKNKDAGFIDEIADKSRITEEIHRKFPELLVCKGSELFLVACKAEDELLDDETIPCFCGE